MKLLEQYRQACEMRHYARKTTATYTRWVAEFIRFHHEMTGAWKHPAEMGRAEVEAFLTHLAVNRRLAESSQNQAFAALLFLFQHLLQRELGPIDALRAQRPQRLPTVLSREEVQKLIAAMPTSATQQLMVESRQR